MRHKLLSRIYILTAGVLICCSSLFSQVVISEKSSIHVEVIDVNKPSVEITQPEMIQGKTAIFDESKIKVFGKLKNGKGNERVFINNNPTTLTPDKYFFADVILSSGFSDLKVVVISDGKLVNEISYPVYYAVRQKNFSTPSLLAGKYYALIMGVDKYNNPGLRDLDRPIADAKALFDVLTTKYNFKKEDIMLLPDPTRNDIIDALDKLQSKVTANDNLIIFYAGHGTYDRDAKIGFWLPADATKESRSNWLSNSNLTDYLKLIKTKHTLVISDACFSGSIFLSRGAFEGISKPIEKAYELPSRQALTSGSLYEVPDNSVFIFYLLDRLNKNTEPYLTAEQLYINIKIAIQNNSEDNTQFGDIQGVGHEGGDFVFIRKDQ
jgi:hypothetical protein